MIKCLSQDGWCPWAAAPTEVCWTVRNSRFHFTFTTSVACYNNYVFNSSLHSLKIYAALRRWLLPLLIRRRSWLRSYRPGRHLRPRLPAHRRRYAYPFELYSGDIPIILVLSTTLGLLYGLIQLQKKVKGNKSLLLKLRK